MKKTGDNKGGNAVAPTSTALQARVMIFQASQRPRYKEGDWMESKHGRSRVSGRLGQRHADILESILYVAEKDREIDDGGVEMLIDIAKVRRQMSDKQYSLQQVQKLLADLRAATIEIVTPEMEKTGDMIIGGLIDHIVPSSQKRRDPLTGGMRNLWRVRIGVALVMLLNKDIKLYYDPSLIARLQHGNSQAVARYVLTHKTSPAGGWHIDTVLRAVLGESAKSQAMRDGRRRLEKDVAMLNKIGVIVDSGRIVKREVIECMAM